MIRRRRDYPPAVNNYTPPVTLTRLRIALFVSQVDAVFVGFTGDFPQFEASTLRFRKSA